MGQMMAMVASVLRVAGRSLRHLPNTLAAELLGRLGPNAKQNEMIASLASQCHSAGLRYCSLLPVFQCFDAPIEALLFSLEGNSQQVSSVMCTNSLWSTGETQMSIYKPQVPSVYLQGHQSHSFLL